METEIVLEILEFQRHKLKKLTLTDQFIKEFPWCFRNGWNCRNSKQDSLTEVNLI